MTAHPHSQPLSDGVRGAPNPRGTIQKVNTMDYPIISADDHIDLRWLPRDLWSSRLPAHLRERGPQVRDTDKGAFWYCDEQMWGTWGAYTAAQGSGAMWAVERGGGMREGELRPTEEIGRAHV